MAALELKYLTELDNEIQAEHKAWLVGHGFRLNVNAENNVFGLLAYPELWSGNRMGETSIHTEESRKNSAVADMENIFKKRKMTFKGNKVKSEENQKLEEEYQQFLAQLKERFLARAIEATLAKIPITEETNDLSSFYDLADRSPVNFQTQDQCVAEHAKITAIIKTHREKPGLNNELAKLEQLEILSKRKLDMHYETATKKTKADLVLNGITATSSTIGLVTGVAAIALWIGGFFFPPLWAPAAVLSYVSFASYAGTAISVGKVVRNGVNGRPPSMEETKDLAIEAALLPLNFIGSAFSSIGRFFNSFKTTKALSNVGNVFNNGVSNFLDVPFTKEIVEEGKTSVNDLAAKKLAHSTSTTSMTKVTSMLLAQHSVQDVQAPIQTLKDNLNSYGTVLAMVSNNQNSILTTTASQHATIATWEPGFFAGLKYKKELKFIQAALDHYKHLPVNATYETRYLALQEIQGECINFRANMNPELAVVNQVLELQNAVFNESQNLTGFIEGEELRKTVPEEARVVTPIMVGR